MCGVKDNNVGSVANDGFVGMNDILLCVPFIGPSNDNKIIVQTLRDNNKTDLSYNEGKTFYKIVPNANNFLFDLGMESGIERLQYKKSWFSE